MNTVYKNRRVVLLFLLIHIAGFFLLMNDHIISYAEDTSQYKLSKDSIWYYQVKDESEKTAVLVQMNRDSGVELSGDGITGTYTIPAVIDGYKVVNLGKSSLDDGDKGALEGLKSEDIKVIVIPEGIISIGEKCFYNTNIVEVIMPDSLVEIGERAFNYSQKLEKVTFGKGVTTIGNGAFLLCSKLDNVELPDTLKHIGDKAFQECTSLESIIIPDSVEVIGEQAFAVCSNLGVVSFGEGVSEIGKYAFVRCNALKSVVIPDSVTSLGYCAFAQCNLLGSVIVGDGIDEVTEGAFLGCTNLTKVILPKTLSSIGKGAFNGCSFLESIDLPDSLKSIGDSAFYNCEKLSKIDLPDGLETIDNYAFKACKSLTEINIPSTVVSIGNEAFLTNYITVTDESTGEQYNKLIDDAQVLKITIADKLDNVADLNLTVYGDVIFNVNEDNSTVINYFTDNSVTNYITYSNASPSDNEDSENSSGNGTGTTVTDGGEDKAVTDKKDDGNVGAGETDVNSTTSKDSSINVENDTPKTTDSITEYKVGKTYTSGSYKYKILSKSTASFVGITNKKLTTVKIPATVKFGKKSYKVTEIGKNTFKGNKKIKKITIGSNVKKIGTKAFMNCKALRKMSIKTKNLKSVGKAAFKGVTFGAKGIDITVPKGKKEKYTRLIVKAR